MSCWARRVASSTSHDRAPLSRCAVMARRSSASPLSSSPAARCKRAATYRASPRSVGDEEASRGSTLCRAAAMSPAAPTLRASVNQPGGRSSSTASRQVRVAPACRTSTTVSRAPEASSASIRSPPATGTGRPAGARPSMVIAAPGAASIHKRSRRLSGSVHTGPRRTVSQPENSTCNGCGTWLSGPGPPHPWRPAPTARTASQPARCLPAARASAARAMSAILPSMADELSVRLDIRVLLRFSDKAGFRPLLKVFKG